MNILLRTTLVIAIGVNSLSCKKDITVQDQILGRGQLSVNVDFATIYMNKYLHTVKVRIDDGQLYWLSGSSSVPHDSLRFADTRHVVDTVIGRHTVKCYASSNPVLMDSEYLYMVVDGYVVWAIVGAFNSILRCTDASIRQISESETVALDLLLINSRKYMFESQPTMGNLSSTDVEEPMIVTSVVVKYK